MMQTFIGMDYDRGLGMLKELIETGEIASQINVKGVLSVGPINMLGVQGTCAVADISNSMEANCAKAKKLFAKHNLPTDLGMMAVYHKLEMKTGTFSYTAGYLVPEFAVGSRTGLSSWSTPKIRAFCVEHIGPYRNLRNAWSTANQIVRRKKLKQSRVGTLELYKTTPPGTPDADLCTHIYLPLK